MLHERTLERPDRHSLKGNSLQRQVNVSRSLPALVVYTHIVGTAVIRALGQADVPVVALHYDNEEVGYLSRYVTESIRVPSLRHDEAAFLNRVMELGERFTGALLIPTDDYSLSTLSKHKKRLATKYLVAADDWDRVSQCINKQHTYARAKALGIPCPITFWVRSWDDVRKCQNALHFPYLMKPCQGHRFQDLFGTKMFKIENEQQLAVRYEQVRDAGIELMLQEIIPGADSEGVNYNSYFVDGAPMAEFTAKKVRLEPPFFGSPRVIVSKVVPDIIQPGRALLRDLGYTGFSCMEFKRDIRNGLYVLMEINCRNNRSGSLAVRCGINFPWMMYQHLINGKTLVQQGFRENIAWIEGTSDIIRFFVSHSVEQYSFRDYIRPYCHERVFALLSLGDPLPFLKRTELLARKALRQFTRRLRSDKPRTAFPRLQIGK